MTNPMFSRSIPCSACAELPYATNTSKLILTSTYIASLNWKDIWSVVLPDVNVTCLVHEDCLLPCPFRPTSSVVIHWYKQQIPVHSFYYNKDQFGLQNKHFSGRTSLFNSQIPQGNASLLLKRVKVQDRAAHIQTVLLETTDETVTCSSSNIYPVPQLFWMTDPPLAQEALDNATIKITDHKGLFTVESTLRIVGNLSDFTYFCSVTSADKMQLWTASQKMQENIIQEEGHSLSIPCIAPHHIQNYSLVWTFTSFYEPVVILRYDTRTRQTFNLWEGQSELDQDLLLIGDGSLLINKPDTDEHSGIYTCVFSSDQGRHTVKTHVNITVPSISIDVQSVQRSRWSTVASVIFVLIVIIVALPQFVQLHIPLPKSDTHLSAHSPSNLLFPHDSSQNHNYSTYALHSPSPHDVIEGLCLMVGDRSQNEGLSPKRGRSGALALKPASKHSPPGTHFVGGGGRAEGLLSLFVMGRLWTSLRFRMEKEEVDIS
ncbi:hypothetical protein WMY93_008407 [Mugilogobius chulae]|uniref:Ig-like domain-containing protein n=1 Tax=Mugilogobius chulae TaxID=88201 RepID=A0AAW0PKS8_9GOBI